MNEFIAYCGLNCETCEARMATMNHDDTLREKVAKLWSELNGVEITPEMIHCVGCRIDGVKTPYCESLCPIRLCAIGRGMETCGNCGEMERCEKLRADHRTQFRCFETPENSCMKSYVRDWHGFDYIESGKQHSPEDYESFGLLPGWL